MNGILAISKANLFFGIIQIVGSVLNFGILLNTKSISAKQKTEDLILVMNSMIALIIAFEYFKDGGKYIQYVWMLTSILYIIVLVIKRSKKYTNGSDLG